MRSMTSYVKGEVVSRDGTPIGFRQMRSGSSPRPGPGPGVILIHGGMKSAQDFMKLGAALSTSFTVYIPDRRGRGLSGPHGDRFSVQREVEDLQALVDLTRARYIFGYSSGALGVHTSTCRSSRIRSCETRACSTFFGHAFQVDPSRVDLAGLLLAAAGPAADGGGEDRALCDFVPPFLLVGGPDFILAAVDAAEREIGVEAAGHKQRLAIAVVRSEGIGVHRDRTGGATYQLLGRMLFRHLPGFSLRPPLINLGSSLLPALHMH